MGKCAAAWCKGGEVDMFDVYVQAFGVPALIFLILIALFLLLLKK